MLSPPTHPGEQVKCFEDMSENDHHQTSGAKELQEGARSLSPKEHHYRTQKSMNTGTNAPKDLSNVTFIARRSMSKDYPFVTTPLETSYIDERARSSM